ncbi:MAG: pantetheine-phosphate adenylyltransferase [Candidatus Eisenbacteria bacterium]
MRRALYPGTFDPVTNGHLDLVKRALRLFDGVVVAVGTGRDKSPMFSVEERIGFFRDAVQNLANVEVISIDGLLVDTVSETGTVAIIRGLREVSDFEYEFQMALMNRRLARDIETVFLMPSLSYIYLDSTIMKEVALLGGDVDGLAPEAVIRALQQKRGSRRRTT